MPSLITVIFAFSIAGGINPSFAIEYQTIEMEKLLDRSEADARGVKKVSGGGDNIGTKPEDRQTVVMPGEANRKGGIYDRLSHESTYTGVRKGIIARYSF